MLDHWSPADVMGLTGQAATTAVGSLTPADVMGVTGVEATTSLGEPTISTNNSSLQVGKL